MWRRASPCECKIVAVCHSIKAISPSMLSCWVCESLCFRSVPSVDVGVQCGGELKGAREGGGSPSRAVIISRVGCQRAAWLCGCWRGAITLKSLVWQAFGLSVCLCFLCVRVCIVYAGAHVWARTHRRLHLWVSDYTYPSVHTWACFSVCQPVDGGGWDGGEAASVNVRNRNKPTKQFSTCRQGWKQKEQQGENWFHISFLFNLVETFSPLIKAGGWWE